MMRARDDTSTSEGQESGYLKIGFWIFWKNMFLGKLTNFSSNMFRYKKKPSERCAKNLTYNEWELVHLA